MVQSAVEDAFRTQLSAAGPAVRRGLLVIRKIDLGVISSRRDQSMVNRRLAALLRNAATHAAIDFGEDLDQREAVLFPDPIYPLLKIARAIGSGNAVPQSWPYRAILGHRLLGPPAALLAAILARQLEVPQGGPGVRAILFALGPQLPKLVVALPAALQIDVLRALTVESEPASRGAAQLDQAGWRQFSQDLARVQNHSGIVWLLDQTSVDLRAKRAVLQILVALMIGEDGRPAQFNRVELVSKILLAVASIPHGGGSTPLLLRYLSESGSKISVAFIRELSNHAQMHKLPTHDELVPLLLGLVQGELASQAAMQGADAALTDRGTVGSAIEAGRGSADREEAAATKISGFAPTNHAGISYLIALMNTVYGSWFNRPEHIVQASGQRLLNQIMSRFSLHAEDPALCFLRSLGELPELNDTPLEYCLSPAMLTERDAVIAVSRISKHSGWRMATIGRLIIAVWNGCATGEVRALLQHGSTLSRLQPREAPEKAVLVSCEVGLRRYLRAGPKLKITDLIERRGELACTATHMDVSFDASLIDLSVRRWALDLSPNWCPWLWRVVTIHYDFGDHFGAPDAA